MCMQHSADPMANRSLLKASADTRLNHPPCSRERASRTLKHKQSLQEDKEEDKAKGSHRQGRLV